MGGSASGIEDELAASVDLQTQTAILQSDTLVLQVVKELDLEHNKDFQRHLNPLSFVLGLVASKGPKDPQGSSLEDSPARRTHVTKTFASHLKVKVQPGTRLIEISYSNPDPKVSAKVVNHLMDALVTYTFQTKYKAMNQVSDWLTTQLESLRRDSQKLQGKVVLLQKDTGLFGVGGTDPQGKPIIYSPVLDRLEQSTTLMSQAEMNRILKESIYRITLTGNAELISQLSGTSLSGPNAQGVTTSFALIQTLRAQETTIKAQLSQDESQLGPNNPRIIQERANLTGIDVALKDEVARIAARAKNDYEIAVQAEEATRKTYEANRSAADRLNDKTIEYEITSREAEKSQELYQELLKDLKRAGVTEGLRSSNLTVVDPARAAASPSTPNIPLILLLGMVMGVFVGCVGSLLIDGIDNKVQGIEEIEAMHLMSFGLLPKIVSPGNTPVSTSSIPGLSNSAYAESIRGLRSAVLLSRSGAPPKTLLISSGGPAEGKSTISLSLAASLSQLSRRVLLVEVDLRRPTLQRRLGLAPSKGLSALLSGQTQEADVQPVSDFPNLYVLQAGPVPPNPAELIGSDRMKSLVAKWSSEYDHIVFDCPPILPVVDVRLLMELADSTILVARADVTSRLTLQRSYKLIAPHAKNPDSPSVGIVLNAVPPSSEAYYGYYGYYGHRKYEYGSEGKDNENV